MVYVIGLTGGIGSGKSAVSDRFAALGVTIADADVASRAVMQPGTDAFNAIVEHFGAGCLDPDGALDRAALRRIVFADAAERRWLESVTVPAIMRNLRDTLTNAASPYAILILSSGNGQNPLIDRQLVVDVSPETQIERTMQRDNNSREQVAAIMAAQISREDRLAYADDVIVNDGALALLEEEVIKLHHQYLELARK